MSVHLSVPMSQHASTCVSGLEIGAEQPPWGAETWHFAFLTLSRGCRSTGAAQGGPAQPGLSHSAPPPSPQNVWANRHHLLPIKQPSQMGKVNPSPICQNPHPSKPIDWQ